MAPPPVGPDIAAVLGMVRIKRAAVVAVGDVVAVRVNVLLAAPALPGRRLVRVLRARVCSA